jgi:hypothetical protein
MEVRIMEIQSTTSSLYQNVLTSLAGQDGSSAGSQAASAATQGIESATRTETASSMVASSGLSPSNFSSAMLEEAYRAPLSAALSPIPSQPDTLPSTHQVDAPTAISPVGAFNGSSAGGREIFQQLASMGQSASTSQAAANGSYAMMQQLLSSEPTGGTNLDVTA